MKKRILFFTFLVLFILLSLSCIQTVNASFLEKPITKNNKKIDDVEEVANTFYFMNSIEKSDVNPVLVVLFGLLTWPLGLIIGILGAVPLAILEFYTAIFINGYGLGIALFEMIKGFFVSIVMIGVLWPYFLYFMLCVEPPF